MKRKVIFVAVLVVLAMSALPVACAAPAEGPEEELTKPVEIVGVTASSWTSAGYGYRALTYTADLITQATDGRFEFTFMPADTAVPNAEHLMACRDGVFQMSYLWEGYWIDLAPALAVLSGTSGYLVKGAHDGWELYKRGFEDIRVRVYDDFNAVPVGQACYPGNGLFSNKPLDSLESLKGQKLACSGSGAQTVESLGGSAVDASFEELFTGMASGLVDGGIDANPVTWKDLGLMDVTKYWLIPVTMPGSMQEMIANADFWNSLSEGDQYLFQYCFQWAQARQRYEIDYEIEGVLNEATAKGITINHWTEDEWKQWKQAILQYSPAYPDDPLWREANDLLLDYCEEMGYL